MSTLRMALAAIAAAGLITGCAASKPAVKKAPSAATAQKQAASKTGAKPRSAAPATQTAQADRIVCVDEARTGTHLKTRTCASEAQWSARREADRARMEQLQSRGGAGKSQSDGASPSM